MTVRGQTVQGGSVPLRKAPLRSMVYSWSTKRPCGPLAFRRATEGSRVQRKMRGSQEGDKKPFGVLSPSCPCRWAPTIPPPPGGGNARPAHRQPISPPAANRCIGAAGGEKRPVSGREEWPPSAARKSRCSPAGIAAAGRRGIAGVSRQRQKGTGHQVWFPVPS